MPKPAEPRLVTITEAAELLGIRKTTIYKLMKSGQLPYVRLPGATPATERGRRIEIAEIDALIKRQRVA